MYLIFKSEKPIIGVFVNHVKDGSGYTRAVNAELGAFKPPTNVFFSDCSNTIYPYRPKFLDKARTKVIYDAVDAIYTIKIGKTSYFSFQREYAKDHYIILDLAYFQTYPDVAMLQSLSNFAKNKLHLKDFTVDKYDCKYPFIGKKSFMILPEIKEVPSHTKEVISCFSESYGMNLSFNLCLLYGTQDDGSVICMESNKRSGITFNKYKKKNKEIPFSVYENIDSYLQKFSNFTWLSQVSGNVVAFGLQDYVLTKIYLTPPKITKCFLSQELMDFISKFRPENVFDFQVRFCDTFDNKSTVAARNHGIDNLQRIFGAQSKDNLSKGKSKIATNTIILNDLF